MMPCSDRTLGSAPVVVISKALVAEAGKTSQYLT